MQDGEHQKARRGAEGKKTALGKSKRTSCQGCSLHIYGSAVLRAVVCIISDMTGISLAVIIPRRYHIER